MKDYDKQNEIKIKVYKGPINCFLLNKDITIIITAIDKETLIRLFDISNTESIQEFRRGSENAYI